MWVLDAYRKYLIKRKSEDIELKVKELEQYLKDSSKLVVVHDELIDFFDLINNRKTRWQAFRRYIEINYKLGQFEKILDVGCGPFRDLSIELENKGYIVDSIDPRIEIEDENHIVKGYFNYQKTDVSKYDLLVGLEPCDATEHIMKSGLNNNIPFAVALCAAPHNSISGRKFKTMEEWYEYLLKESQGEAIIEEKRILQKRFDILRNKR